ncbi:MAG TPA: SDR family oxidoreductase [Acidimicrobiales bacterium]|nr:SDR family oxidoreductase [Acidimicrobiales bacterium]
MAQARSLAGLRTLVTGASSGIGAATSILLAQHGARVVGTGRDAEALAANNQHFVTTICWDLLEGGAPSAVVSGAVDALGGLDVLVSNAGAGWLGPFETMSPEEVDSVLDLNLRAPLHLAHAASKHLRSSAVGGQLVLVGSIAGLLGVAEEVAYCTAKAGLRGLAESLRAEWTSGVGGSQNQVTVTLVSPGPVDTPFFERRNQPYMRSWPKPVPVETVASTIVGTIERRLEDVVVPGWLAFPARLNGGLPALYRRLSGLEGRLH